MLSGENFKIPIGIYDDLFESFIHLVRNSLDHGIESVESRIAKNKDKNAQIKIHTERFENNNDDWIRIIFSDDGRGMDIEKIKRKISAKGINIKNINEEDILSCLIKENISSKDYITELSGRGVGLSAVNNQVIKLSGKFSIKTIWNKGSEFIVEVPLEKIK